MQTPFEEVGGSTWTTWEPMVDFIHALADSSDRAEVVQLGRSLHDRPIYAVAVGYPFPRLDGPVAFHVAGQHGNEVGGHEGALAQARDLTETTDPVAVATLQRVTWLILPSASPDTMALSKFNSLGLNLNRDHQLRTLPEARAIAKALFNYRPCLTLDSHSSVITQDFVAIDTNPQLGHHPAVADMSARVLEAIVVALESRGMTFLEFQGRGKDLPDVLSNAAAFAHSASILLESSRHADPLHEQATIKIVMDAAHAFLGEHLDDMVNASNLSRSALVTPTVVSRSSLTFP